MLVEWYHRRAAVTIGSARNLVLVHIHFGSRRRGYYPHLGLVCRSKGRGSPYSITERRVPELIPVLGSQPAGDVSHKPVGRLPLLSARPAVTLVTLKRAATS